MRAEVFFGSSKFLYGGLGKGKLSFVIQKMCFSAVNFVTFFFFKILDPDPDWTLIRIGIQPKMLDPDLYLMSTDPKHCFFAKEKRFSQY